MALTEIQVLSASKFSIRNKDQIKQSKLVGCYYCLTIFSPSEITDWTDGSTTAICPHCAIDSILGDSSSYEITKENLKQLNGYWFSNG